MVVLQRRQAELDWEPGDQCRNGDFKAEIGRGKRKVEEGPHRAYSQEANSQQTYQ